MRTPALWLAALLALLLAGCGAEEEGGGGTAAEPTRTVTVPQRQVVVQAAEQSFDAAEVFRRASPGVVTIRAVFGAGRGAAEGSGFVVDGEGGIVTNAHVVTDEGGGSREAAEEVFVEFPDRNVLAAEIVGFDPFADVALLEVEPGGLQLQPLELGDDRDLVVGQAVAAIGSPFGERQSLSVGVVSAIDRSVESLTRFQIEGAIQTDASINPGNSGGPLLDAGARVVGINQQIETSSGANDGVGFAVPVSTVKRSIAQLERDGEAEYAYIGISTQSLYPQLAQRLDLDTDHGGLVAEVVPGSPAAEAGLREGKDRLRFQAVAYDTGGDVILAVEGHEIVQPNDLAQFISLFRPGEEVTLEVLRDGEPRQIEVNLDERPRG
jgi:S1-C subfamily serine protease